MAEWSLEAFGRAESVGPIVVAAPPGREGELARDGLVVVAGGAARAESVANALAQVDTELVAVHDAARPLVTPELIDDVVAALVADQAAAAAIAARPVVDTIKEAGETAAAPRPVERTLDRGRLWAAQTPQAFRVEALRAAIGAAGERLAEATDEAMLIERAGGRVLLCPAPPENLKVTTPIDLRVAELLLGERGV